MVRQSPPASAGSFSATYIGAGAGHAYDPRHREGLALLTSNLVGSGAGPLGRIRLRPGTGSIGGYVGPSLDPESVELTVWDRSRLARRRSNLWALAVTRPRFSQEDIARVRRQVLQRQDYGKSRNPTAVVSGSFIAPCSRGATHIGERASGRPTACAESPRRTCSVFTGSTSPAREGRSSLRPGRARPSSVVLFVGDWNPWGSRRHPHRPEIPKPIPLGEPTQARGDARSRTGRDPDGGSLHPQGRPRYTAAYLANEVLGGRPLMSRLFQNVREEHGLAYGCSSDLEALRWGGMWQVHAGTGQRIGRRRSCPYWNPKCDASATTSFLAMSWTAFAKVRWERSPCRPRPQTGAHSLAVEVAWYGLPADFYRTWPKHLKELETRRRSDRRPNGRLIHVILQQSSLVLTRIQPAMLDNPEPRKPYA